MQLHRLPLLLLIIVLTACSQDGAPPAADAIQWEMVSFNATVMDAYGRSGGGVTYYAVIEYRNRTYTVTTGGVSSVMAGSVERGFLAHAGEIIAVQGRYVPRTHTFVPIKVAPVS